MQCFVMSARTSIQNVLIQYIKDQNYASPSNRYIATKYPLKISCEEFILFIF